MNVLLWILLGGFVGWIYWVVIYPNQKSLSDSIIVGILGAVIGGWVITLFSNYDRSVFNFAAFLFSGLGSVVLLALVNYLRDEEIN